MGGRRKGGGEEEVREREEEKRKDKRIWEGEGVGGETRDLHSSQLRKCPNNK